MTVALLAEGHESEVTVVRRHLYFFADFYQRLFPETIGDHILDADDFQVPLFGKGHEFRQTGHRAVFVHDLHQGTGRVEACHSAEIDGGFGMSTATQHTVVLGIERTDVSRAPESLRF